MEPDLSERYNDGLIPAPVQPAASPRLRPPAWRPTPIQVEAARKRLGLSLAILAILLIACVVIVTLILEWGL